MNSEADKSCVYIFKIGVTYTRIKFIYAALMHKISNEAINKYNKDNSNKNSVPLNPKTIPLKTDVPSLIFTILDP